MDEILRGRRHRGEPFDFVGYSTEFIDCCADGGNQSRIQWTLIERCESSVTKAVEFTGQSNREKSYRREHSLWWVC